MSQHLSHAVLCDLCRHPVKAGLCCDMESRLTLSVVDTLKWYIPTSQPCVPPSCECRLVCVFQEFLIQKTRIYGLQYVLFPSATSYTSYTLHVPYLLDLKPLSRFFDKLMMWDFQASQLLNRTLSSSLAYDEVWRYMIFIGVENRENDPSGWISAGIYLYNHLWYHLTKYLNLLLMIIIWSIL